MSLAANFNGTLTFVVHEVSHLKSKIDPYVKISTGSRSVKTSFKKDCSNGATYEEKLAMSFNGSEDQVKLEVWDHDRWSSDDLEDGSTVPIQRIMEWADGTPKWINLNGGIKVKITICK